jgi:hypothetical protein
MKYIDYPSYCTLVPDGPCHQKVVMIALVSKMATIDEFALKNIGL